MTRTEEVVGMDSGKLALSVPEVAELLGISRAFAYELVARRELPALRLGRRLVVPRHLIEALLNQVEQRS
jgi:excisionase family DNA binding protein